MNENNYLINELINHLIILTIYLLCIIKDA